MSEQNDNLSLDQLLEDDGFDLGGNVPDYDPFAQASDVFSGEAADAQDAEEVPSRDDPSGTIRVTTSTFDGEQRAAAHTKQIGESSDNGNNGQSQSDSGQGFGRCIWQMPDINPVDRTV